MLFYTSRQFQWHIKHWCISKNKEDTTVFPIENFLYEHFYIQLLTVFHDSYKYVGPSSAGLENFDNFFVISLNEVPEVCNDRYFDYKHLLSILLWSIHMLKSYQPNLKMEPQNFLGTWNLKWWSNLKKLFWLWLNHLANHLILSNEIINSI